MQINIQEEIPCPRVKSLCFHRDRPVLLLALHNGEIRAYDYSLSTFISTFTDHDGPVRSIDFHPTNDLFISGGDDQKVRIWDYHTKNCHALTGHTDYIRCVRFHPYEPFLLSTSDDRTIKIWNFQSKKKVKTLAGHTNYVMAALFLTSHRIISVSLDQTIRIWNIEDGTSEIIEAHDKGINALALMHKKEDTTRQSSSTQDSALSGSGLDQSNQDFLICTGSDDKTIKLFDSDLLHRDTCTYHTRAVTALTCLYSSLVSVGEDGNIFINRRKVVKRLERDGRFWCVSHNHRGVIAAGGDNCFLLFTLKQPVLFDTSFYLKDNQLLNYLNEPLLDLRKEVTSFFSIDTHLIVNYQHKFEVYRRNTHLKGNSSNLGGTGSKGISSNLGGTGSKGISSNLGGTGSKGISSNLGGTGSKGISSILGGTSSKGISSNGNSYKFKGTSSHLKGATPNLKASNLKNQFTTGRPYTKRDRTISPHLTLLWGEMGHATFFNHSVVAMTNCEFNSFTLDGRIIAENMFQQDANGMQGTATHLFVYHNRRLLIMDTEMNRQTITVPFNITRVQHDQGILVIIGRNDLVLLREGNIKGRKMYTDQFSGTDMNIGNLDGLNNLSIKDDYLSMGHDYAGIKNNSSIKNDDTNKNPDINWHIIQHLTEMPRIFSVFLHRGIVFYTTEKQFKYVFDSGEGVVCSCDSDFVVGLVKGEIGTAIGTGSGKERDKGISSENIKVTSSDNSKVTSSDNSDLTSSDNSKVTSSENTKVTGSDNSKVTGSDNSKVTSSYNSKVLSSDNYKLNSSDNSKVTSSDNAGSTGSFVFLFITADQQLVHREVSLDDLLFKQAVLVDNHPLINSLCQRLPGMALVQYLKQYGRARIALPYIEDRREKLLLFLSMGDYQEAGKLIRNKEEHQLLIGHVIRQINTWNSSSTNKGNTISSSTNKGNSSSTNKGIKTNTDNENTSSTNQAGSNGNSLMDALEPHFPVILQSLSHCPAPLHFLFLFCAKRLKEIAQVTWHEKNCQLYQGIIRGDRNQVYGVVKGLNREKWDDISTNDELSDFSTEEIEKYDIDKLTGGLCLNTVPYLNISNGPSSEVNSSQDRESNSYNDPTSNSSKDPKVNSSQYCKPNSSKDSKVNSSNDLTLNSSNNSNPISSKDSKVNSSNDLTLNSLNNSNTVSSYTDLPYLPELLHQKLLVYGTDTTGDRPGSLNISNSTSNNDTAMFMNDLLSVLALFDQNRIKECRKSLLVLLYTGARTLSEPDRYLIGSYLAAIDSERKRKKETEIGSIIDRARFFYQLNLLGIHRRRQAETYVAVCYKNGNYETAKLVAQKFIDWAQTSGEQGKTNQGDKNKEEKGNTSKETVKQSGDQTVKNTTFDTNKLNNVPLFTETELRPFYRILSSNKNGDQHVPSEGHFCTDTGTYRTEWYQCRFCGNDNEKKQCGICEIGSMEKRTCE